MFKFRKKKPEKVYCICKYREGGRTIDLTESEMYELLHEHIDKYKFWDEGLKALTAPTIDTNCEDIFIKIIKEACINGGHNHFDLNQLARMNDDAPANVRKQCFALGEFLCSIYKYQESQTLMSDNMQMEKEYINYLQRELGIGV